MIFLRKLALAMISKVFSVYLLDYIERREKKEDHVSEDVIVKKFYERSIPSLLSSLRNRITIGGHVIRCYRYFQFTQNAFDE